MEVIYKIDGVLGTRLINMTDLRILTIIHCLDRSEAHCCTTNAYIAKTVRRSERTVTESVKKLSNLGLITIINFDGRVRTIKANTDGLIFVDKEEFLKSSSLMVC